MKHLQTVFALALVLAALLACGGSSAPAPLRASAEPPPSAPAAPELVDTPFDAIRRQQSLQEAIGYATPYLADTVGEVSAGELLLTNWARDRLTKKELDALPATSFKAVQKDSDETRGRRLCATGQVVQIERSRLERWEASKVWRGLLMTPSRDVIHYSAVGETSEIVEGTTATLCGVVVGRYSYSNAGGGTTHAVAVVGHFRSYEK